MPKKSPAAYQKQIGFKTLEIGSFFYWLYHIITPHIFYLGLLVKLQHIYYYIPLNSHYISNVDGHPIKSHYVSHDIPISHLISPVIYPHHIPITHLDGSRSQHLSAKLLDEDSGNICFGLSDLAHLGHRLIWTDLIL